MLLVSWFVFDVMDAIHSMTFAPCTKMIKSFFSLILYQGVKAVIAKSFERIHRSNLVGMGIIPLCFKPGEDADTLELTGHERYTIDLPDKMSEIRPGQDVTVTTDAGKSFTCTVRFDTEVFSSLARVGV